MPIKSDTTYKFILYGVCNTYNLNVYTMPYIPGANASQLKWLQIVNKTNKKREKGVILRPQTSENYKMKQNKLKRLTN